MAKLSHRDIASTGPDKGTTCVWCFESRKIPARYRVWSRAWEMFMSTCRKHTLAIIKENANG